MAEIRSYGLKSIKIGAIGAGGIMGAVLAALGLTYQDTADFVQDDPEVEEMFSEEEDDPIEIFETKGVTRINWSIMNFDPEVLAEVLGGAATGVAPNQVWEAPSASESIERSIEVITKSGLKISIPRAKISAKINMAFRKRGLALVEISARVMKPTAAGLAPYTIGKEA